MPSRRNIAIIAVSICVLALITILIVLRRPKPPTVDVSVAPVEPSPVSNEPVVEPGTITGSSAGDNAFGQANGAFANHDYDEAIRGYSRVIQLAPHYVNAFVALGNAHLARGEHQLAMEDYSAALSQDSQNPNALFARGVLYWLSGELARSETDFRKVIEINSDDQQAYERLATVLAEADRTREIAAMYKKVYMADHRRDWALMGWLGGLFNNKDYQGTLKVCDAIAESETPTPTAVVLYRGLVEYELQDYAKAIDDLNEVIKMDPHELAFLAYEKLYLAYRAQHMTDECIKALGAYSLRDGRQHKVSECSEEQNP